MRQTHYDRASKIFYEFASNDFIEFIEKTIIKQNNPDDFEMFSLNLVYDSIQHGMPTIPKDTVASANMMYHLYHWRKTGQKIYEVSDSLAWMLAHTETNIDASFLKLPFPSIYVQIPDHLFTIQDEITGVHKVDSFYIHAYDKDCHWFRIMVIGIPNERSANEVDDALFYFKLTMNDGQKVKDAIAENMKKAAGEVRSEAIEHNFHKIPAFFNFVMNVVLYCTSAEADIDWHPAFKKLWEKRKKLKKARQIERVNQEIKNLGTPKKLLGGRIVISREDKEAYSQSFRTGERQIGVRFQVSGHWRNQWYGSEKENTRHQKPLWIQPFWKGPEVADVINKVRQVGK